MKVRFLTFSKKYNSTLRPDLTQGVEYECVLKSSSDIINPTIELQVGLTSNPSSYNYCYIADYNRWYWVNEWTFANRLWTATLNVDVLATWRPYIGNTDMYVYRSSNEYDGKLLDMKYHTTADVTVNTVNISEVNTAFSSGYFVVGVYGDSNNNTTMAYYVITASNFGTFVNQIYTRGVGDDSIWSGIGMGIRNAIFDISSYIKSLKWFPYAPYDINTLSQSIKVGAMTIQCPNYKITSNPVGFGGQPGGMISIPKHPQAQSRGSYCNISPYSRYRLTFVPFGIFELDSTIVGLYTYLFFHLNIDPITGSGFLSVFVSNASDGTNSVLLMTAEGNYGIDIPISVSQTNIPSIASSLAGAGISAMHGNVFSAGVSAISSVAELRLPVLNNISSKTGSLVGINYPTNQLQCRFYALADEDNDSNGRPLCKVRKPANLGGYIEGESNTFSAPATITEMEEVKRFIDNGFYYE